MTKQRLLFVLVMLAGALVAGWSMQGPADALSSTKAYKDVSVTIVVTPSPTPVAALPKRDAKPDAQVASAATLLWDVGPSLGAPRVVAQATQGNTPVQFFAKADPNYAYLHINPGSQGMVLYAGYGTTTYPCVYQVYASYSTAWQVTDWAYGTSSSSGGSGTFPMWNYPTTSNLAWLAEGVTTSYKAFYNAGSPGELAFKSTGGTMTVCFDLQVTVPATQPAGTYTATAQYNLIVTL